MNVQFKKSFLIDIKKITNIKLQESVYTCIIHVEAAETTRSIKNLKKLVGFNDYYRIKIGDYRIGLQIVEKEVFYVVFEHRKEIYNTFP